MVAEDLGSAFRSSGAMKNWKKGEGPKGTEMGKKSEWREDAGSVCGRAYGTRCEANDAMPHTKLQRGENDVCVSHLRHAIGELHLHSVGWI